MCLSIKKLNLITHYELLKYNILMSENKCIVCGVDMGECNPRQYCCKYYCPKQFEEKKCDTCGLDITDCCCKVLPLKQK